jgi:D-beta-D-heptose 7-phosphate kinase/D-beta-D-heptose 1-phosphate adenosyltransferase
MLDYHNGEITVFTNGCFDLLHPGHLSLLRTAKNFGDTLWVGINSDDSVRRLKGPSRPIYNQNERQEILMSLRFVNRVFIFDEDTPEKLIKRLRPDILVKGGDYEIKNVVGRQYAKRVEIIPLLDGYSTTKLIERLKNV